jgi:very-short-patch-repair endonuclease
VRGGPASSGGHLEQGCRPQAVDQVLRRFNRGHRGADLFEVDTLTTAELPPLTASALLDPWRIRHRRLLAGEDLDAPVEDMPRRATRSEALLWSRLQLEPHGWRMEVPTRHRCVLDFYCEAAQLAVEVDGGYHRAPKVARKDSWRDEFHLTLGIATERFSDEDVETDPAWVVERIRALVAQRLGLPVHPLLPAPPVSEPTPWSWAGQLQTVCVDVLPALPAQRGLLSRLSGR